MSPLMTELVKGILGSFLGAVGFSWLVHSPRHTWFPVGCIAAVSYGLYWILGHFGLSEPAAVFCSVLLGTAAGHLAARRLRVINTVFLMSAIVPVVPGLGLYRMMSFFGQGMTDLGAEAGISAMISIAMIALGVAMSTFVDRLVHPPAVPREPDPEKQLPEA